MLQRFICLGSFCLILAAPLPALACSAASNPSAISIRGTITEGGATGTFEQSLDLRNGFSRMSRNNGVQQSVSGFNGIAWTFVNGIPSVIDVPTLVPISAARAFVIRMGWNDVRARPVQVTHESGTLVRTYLSPKMARVTVTSASDLARPEQAVVDADWGPETTTFSDWHCIQGLNYPFVQTQTDPTGESQTIRVSAAQPARIASGAFNLPPRVAHGHLIQSGAVPFHFGGKRDPHIIVDATVGNSTVPLIFDTGGANYFGTKAAQTMGLSMSGGLSITGVGNGTLTGGFARIPSIAVANGVLQNEVAIVSPLPWPDVPNAPVGLTGFEFLAEFRTTIDYPNATIEFANFGDPLPVGGIVVPLRTQGHFPMVEASVNGVAGWFGLDTGDGQAFTLFKRFADNAHIAADPALKHATAGGAGGLTKLSQARLQTFSIGKITVVKPVTWISNASAGPFASRSLAGNLGGGFLRCYKVTLDYQRRVMLLFPNAETDTCLQQATG